MRYRLERRDGIREVPAWWNVGGTAFHETIREWETEQALTQGEARSADATAERFPHHLANAIADEILRDDNRTSMSKWRAGGKESKQYPNKEDRVWWLDHGPEMAAKYVLAQEGRDSEVYRTADGLALELGFLWQIKPDVVELPPLKGFIDQVLYFPRTDSILIRDFKSGSHTPVDTLQLKVYRLALEQVFGITARKWWGDYWMARKGYPTKGLDLTDSAKCEAEVRYRLHAMDMAEELNLYPPNPSSLCSSCGVRPHCPAMSDGPTALWKHGERYGLPEAAPTVAPLSISE